MAITAVGLAGGGFANLATSVTRSVGTVTAGQLVVVWGSKFSPSADAFVAGDCTQSAGTATLGTFQLDRQDGGATSSNFGYTGVWSAIVTTGGTLTVQVGGAVAGSFLLIGAEAFNGTWDSTRLEASNGGLFATDFTASTGTGNATSAGEALFCAALVLDNAAGNTITQDGAFSLVFESESGTEVNGSHIYRIVSTGTTDAGDWTHGTAHVGTAATLAVYKEAGGGGGSAPVLSSPTSTSVTLSGATIGATSDVAGATFYAVIGTSATPPSAAQIKAASGGGIVGGASAALTSGANAVAVSGGASSTLHYGYAVATNGVGDSNVVSTSSFTTTAVAPAVSSVSTATPQNGASLTITGTVFGATQGSGGVTLGGVAQTVTSWADTSITITVARGTNKLGAALGLVVTSGATGLSSPSYSGVTGIAAATGWAIVNLTTPHADSTKRVTTSPVDLAAGDQKHHDTVGGAVTMFEDGTFVADAGVTSFAFEAWSPGLGWGTQGTQTL